MPRVAGRPPLRGSGSRVDAPGEAWHDHVHWLRIFFPTATASRASRLNSTKVAPCQHSRGYFIGASMADTKMTTPPPETSSPPEPLYGGHTRFELELEVDFSTPTTTAYLLTFPSSFNSSPILATSTIWPPKSFYRTRHLSTTWPTFVISCAPSTRNTSCIRDQRSRL